MIGKIISGIFKLVMVLVTALMMPIDALISSGLPSLTSALDSITAMFNYVGNVVGYAVDASGLSPVALTLIVAYYSFTILGTFSVSVVKLALRWYNQLKP